MSTNSGTLENAGEGKELMTRAEVATFAGVSPDTIMRLDLAGKLPAVRISGRLVRYRRGDVEAFFQPAAA